MKIGRCTPLTMPTLDCPTSSYYAFNPGTIILKISNSPPSIAMILKLTVNSI